MTTLREITSDFQRVMQALRYDDYVRAINRYTMDHYGFAADQAYPKTTERVAIACFDEGDEPEIPARLIAEHHNVPRMLTLD